jgi:NADH-quinone oxidoreductase subunit L
MTTLAATGVLRASWLLLAFPVFGAAVLLLGGRRTDKWGHLLGVTMSLASFVYGVIAFFTLLSYPAADRSRDLHLFSWIPVNGFQANIGILLDPLSISFVLLITGVGSLIHIYSIGYMAGDPGRRRLGGRGSRLLPADRVLAVQAVRGGRGEEGVHREPRR